MQLLKNENQNNKPDFNLQWTTGEPFHSNADLEELMEFSEQRTEK